MTRTAAALCLGIALFAGESFAQTADPIAPDATVSQRKPALPTGKTATHAGRFRSIDAFRDTLQGSHCDDEGARIALTAPKLEAAARALEAPLKGLSQQERQETVEFAVGNLFFSLFHELGHAAVTEMGLPVLGREEDAADSFATVSMLQMGTACSQRTLIQSAMGWFLSHERDRRQGVKLPFYGEHGLNRQRAYQIIC